MGWRSDNEKSIVSESVIASISLGGAVGECHVLGLPGNPVSSFVSLHPFGVPALHHWMGLSLPSRLVAVLKRSVKNKGKRPHDVRGQFDPCVPTFDLVGL